MSDIIYKIISGNEFHEGCAISSVSQIGTITVKHDDVIPDSYYSGVIDRLTDRFDDAPIVSGI